MVSEFDHVTVNELLVPMAERLAGRAKEMQRRGQGAPGETVILDDGTRLFVMLEKHHGADRIVDA